MREKEIFLFTLWISPEGIMLSKKIPETESQVLCSFTGTRNLIFFFSLYNFVSSMKMARDWSRVGQNKRLERC